jgi:hypothetical protein
MSDTPSSFSPIQQESIQFNNPVSEASLSALAGAINGLLASTQLVAASYYLSANFVTSPSIPINFDTRNFDTHLAVTVSATNWRFTAPIAGIYFVGGMIESTSTSGAGWRLYRNGGFYSSLADPGNATYGAAISGLVELGINDFIDVRKANSQTVVGGAQANDGVCNIQIFKLSGYIPA